MPADNAAGVRLWPQKLAQGQVEGLDAASRSGRKDIDKARFVLWISVNAGVALGKHGDGRHAIRRKRMLDRVQKRCPRGTNGRMKRRRQPAEVADRRRIAGRVTRQEMPATELKLPLFLGI